MRSSVVRVGMAARRGARAPLAARLMSTQASSGGGSSSSILGFAALAAAAGGGYYYYTNQQGAAPAPAATASDASKVDVAAIKNEIASMLEDENHDDGSYGPILVRLAWHHAGTYDKNSNTGGSDGAAMRFEPEAGWGANAGLHTARAILEKVKKNHPEISYSDLWSLAGNTAIEEMGGPELPFRLGRKDKPSDCKALPDGLLPDADGRDKKDKPADHLRDIFYRMGFNDQEIVALSGAHALGRCHPNGSGYWGPWTRAPTTFSNEYFRLLLDEKWTKKTTHEGKPWTGPEQFEDKTGDLMMLPTDISLIQDDKFRPWVEKYAKDEELFFKDFAKAWTKLQENGVKAFA